MSKGEELFAKEALSMKSLKKLDKDELMSTIEINLQELVDYYYEDFNQKEEREWRRKFMDLILSKKYFLKPLAKIIKESDEEVPDGLAFILYDMISCAAKTVQIKTNDINGSNISQEDKDNAIREMKEELDESREAISDIIYTLNKKTIKKLKKMGFKESYAMLLAPALFNSQYVSVKNLYRFTRTMTNAFYNTYIASLAKNEDDQVVTVAGADLANPKVISQVMSLVTKDMNLGDYAEMIKQILLEKRDKGFDAIKKAMPVYNAITAWCLATLEDKKIFNKATRKALIKSFGDARVRDSKRGTDAKRRVEFSELDPDMYPNIAKAFDRVMHNTPDKE